ncbi:hypothetical protein JTE90_015341 [Oedothorax gibbosus]|uniref:Uncharacterized protein n=2 Tax=Oedothorax gibbosus TaxID=931172 RepID=A0AAV6U4F9_9ARAC|nr:hypothetical protein JTE90_015341 [Oedothorax gibbosus]
MLTITKTALVSKLNQLQLLKLEEERKANEEKNKKINDQPVIDKASFVTKSETSRPSLIEQQRAEVPKKAPDLNSTKGKENEVLDVVDLHKIAKLQEESLRQSTCRFLTLDKTEKKGFDKNQFLLQNSNLCKPLSVEALNLCNGKFEENDYNIVPMHKMKRINGYGSSSSLINAQDTHHRGSLPNINPGYYSLRSKKSKKQTDRLPFPLPIHPSRLPLNTTGSDSPTYDQRPKLSSPYKDNFESRTLPSSYRLQSRSNSCNRKTPNTPSPRRESTSFLPNPKNSPSLSRRESAPCNNPRNLSPLSSPTLYQRSRGISSPVLPSPTKTWRNELMSPTGSGYQQRNASQSPSRTGRLPLTTMHNRSPKCGNSPASPRHEELRGFKVQSRIPSPGPASRSGIPVPSTYMPKGHSDDESWSNDCY